MATREKFTLDPFWKQVTIDIVSSSISLKTFVLTAVSLVGLVVAAWRESAWYYPTAILVVYCTGIVILFAFREGRGESNDEQGRSPEDGEDLYEGHT